MYSPKVREDLVPRLYRAAKACRMPMTRLVAAFVEAGLARLETEATDSNDPRTQRHSEQTEGEHQ